MEPTKKLSKDGETVLGLLLHAAPESIAISGGGQRLDFKEAPGLHEIGPYISALTAEIEARDALIREMVPNMARGTAARGVYFCPHCAVKWNGLPDGLLAANHAVDCLITRAQSLGIVEKD